MRLLQLHRGIDSIENYFIFRGFNCRLAAKNSGISSPMFTTIKFAVYVRYFSLRFGGVLGLTPEEFKNQYDSQSGRI